MQDLQLIKGEHKHLVIAHVSDETAQWHITQEAGSVLTIHLFCLDGEATASHDVLFDIEQAGEHTETYIYGLGVISGKQQVNVRTRVRHSVPNGKSNQLLKFAVKDEAQGAFIGELIVAPHAQHTEAMQTNRNVLLSPAATMHTQPQLEIYADDVQATHGASTGQLDEAALFYMQQRGIGKQKARQLLVNAFMKEVLDTISDDQLREQLLDSIDRVVQ
jgi:ABC-type transport system involved in Fe-S cluster assembly, permease component